MPIPKGWRHLKPGDYVRVRRVEADSETSVLETVDAVFSRNLRVASRALYNRDDGRRERPAGKGPRKDNVFSLVEDVCWECGCARPECGPRPQTKCCPDCQHS